jgi:hypothetical protein
MSDTRDSETKNEKTNGKESQSTTIKNAIICGIISIILSPIATFLTLTTTSTILHQQADLQVVSVEAIAFDAPITIKDDVRSILSKSGDITSALLQRSGVLPYYDPCLEGITLGTVRTYCIEFVKRGINDLIKIIGNEKMLLNDAKKELTMDEAMTLLQRTSRIPDIIDDYLYWSDNDNRKVDTIFLPYTEQLEKVDSALDKVRETLDNSAANRSGKVVIKLGVLNRGGTDSVVFTDGMIYFSGQSMSLKDAGKSRQTGIVIHARSFSSVMLTIDEQKSSAASVRDWKTIVLQRINQEFALTLKSIDGELSATSRLPLTSTPEDEMITDQAPTSYYYPTRSRPSVVY